MKISSRFVPSFTGFHRPNHQTNKNGVEKVVGGDRGATGGHGGPRQRSKNPTPSAFSVDACQLLTAASIVSFSLVFIVFFSLSLLPPPPQPPP